MKYLQTSKYCPMCNTKIHETQPLLNLKLDRVMQDIVYKLVPGLQESEWPRAAPRGNDWGGAAAGVPGPWLHTTQVAMWAGDPLLPLRCPTGTWQGAEQGGQDVAEEVPEPSSAPPPRRSGRWCPVCAGRC